jgi:class 3 adenylate cyclase
MSAFGGKADIGQIEIPQRSNAVLSFRWEAREVLSSETPRVHHAARRRDDARSNGSHIDESVMKGIAEWLESIGLAEYAQRFAENAIDISTLRDLTDQDLKELGVLLGHRRWMLRAIAELDVTTPIASMAPPTEPEREPYDERRHLTVMFCDLVGSTALATRLDPEDMLRAVASYQAAIGAVIGRYQGMIAKYMGDGVLAYFGYPVAHEDSAVLAVRAGLEIVDALASLRTDVSTALQARVGIATGTVVMNELLVNEIPAEKAIEGETPNLAARLRTLAEPGTVLICPRTRQLTGGYFDYRDLGSLSLKGFAQRISASQVLGMSGVESRFEAMHASGLPPLFGREEEMDLLFRRWRQATQEEGRVVVVTGEPGIGKSRIAVALDERLKSESHVTLHYFCSAHHTHSALSPFWPTCWRYRPMITTDCKTSHHKSAKRRPSWHCWPSSMG